MYYRQEDLLEQYDIEVKSISKGRGALICDTDKGMLLQKEFRGMEERAEGLYLVLENLEHQGCLVDTMIRTKEGKLIAKAEGETQGYLLKRHFAGKECNVKNCEEVKKTMEGMATLHHCFAQIGGEVPQILMQSKQEGSKRFQKHNRELVKVKNYIRQKHKRNEFEQLFMSVFDEYYEQAQDTLKKTLLWEEQSKAKSDAIMGLCHGDFTQHNAIWSEGNLAFVHFEQLRYDYYVMDLANFLRKILEKNMYQCSLGEDMIRAYCRKRKLCDEELQYLLLQLSYPQKFWKIANHYINSKKTWVSMRDMEKLENVTKQQTLRKKYLESMLSLSI